MSYVDERSPETSPWQHSKSPVVLQSATFGASERLGQLSILLSEQLGDSVGASLVATIDCQRRAKESEMRVRGCVERARNGQVMMQRCDCGPRAEKGRHLTKTVYSKILTHNKICRGGGTPPDFEFIGG